MSNKDLEETTKLAIDFAKQDLVPAVVQERNLKDILMLGYVNKEALDKTRKLDMQHFGAGLKINYGQRAIHQEIS